MKQERQAVTHGAGLQLKENQTRPLEVTDDEFMGWLADSPKGKRIDEHIAKNRNLTSSKPDFHAKPFKLEEVGLGDLLYCSYEDVLAEREHYQKQLDLFAIERQDWNKSKTNLEYHLEKAEAAEAELKEVKAHHDEHYKNWLTERELRVKAEARVKELEAELKRERNWSKYETKQVKARDKTIKTLAGEKTK